MFSVVQVSFIVSPQRRKMLYHALLGYRVLLKFSLALAFLYFHPSGGTMKGTIAPLAAVLLLGTIVGCAGGNLTTREKGAGIGALGGAAVGGIIGATVGAPGVGAAVGGTLGLGAGALVGDQMQGQETRQADQQRQIDANQAEIDRQRRETEKLRRQNEY
jgi:outer membrane lipoprotein SlyB